jgi:hypothetical protein
MLTAPATEEAVETIDDQIGSDWKAIQEKYAVPEADDAPVEQAPEEKDDRPRDESGKFAKKEAKTEEKELASPIQTKGQIADTTELQQGDQPQRDVNRPPSTWKPVVRAEWDKLTPSVRAEIYRREADFQNGQAQLLPDARLGQSMRQVTEPYRMVVESNYGTPENAMKSFLQTASLLQMGSPQQKLQTIAGIAQQFGIDLSPLAGAGLPQQQPAADRQFQDPRVDQLLAHQRQQEQLRQQSEQQQLEGIANAWIAEKDAQGNPVYPYVGDVMNEMAMLIPQVRQANPLFSHPQVLKEAYDRAVWANPDTRVALQTKQQSELQVKQQAENQQRVASAKRAASVNVPRRASTPSAGKPGSLDDTLRNTARELGLIS